MTHVSVQYITVIFTSVCDSYKRIGLLTINIIRHIQEFQMNFREMLAKNINESFTKHEPHLNIFCKHDIV